jgi:acetyltransferase-like isoleucine patch superfamily enzyme
MLFFRYARFILSSSSVMKIYHHWRLWRKYKSKNAILGFGVSIKNSDLGFDVFVGENSRISDSSVGDNTYFNSFTSVSNAKIGKFCSIGSNVKIGIGAHPTNMVSSHPCFYSNNKGFKTFADKMYFTEEKGEIQIGNDVWIGSEVSVFNNIKIGNGAIVAMGSIVTKDVPDYAIVAGSPAKLIKYRFSEDKIKLLLDIKWWEFDMKTIQKEFKDFHETETFIKKHAELYKET